MYARKKTASSVILGLLLIGGLSLTGCNSQTAKIEHEKQLSNIDLILQRAANDAAARGKTEESLELLQAMYKRNSTNPKIAVRYSGALRHDEQYEKAALVLSSFISEGTATPETLTEYAALKAATGNYILSESYADRAIKINPEFARGHHILGIALDTQGHHIPAEKAFRAALENWSGDPIPVLNNLGLNLAAQGKLDEALTLLQQAAQAAPNRIEIERNLRIVSALGNRKGVYGDYYTKNAPKPNKKPKG